MNLSVTSYILSKTIMLGLFGIIQIGAVIRYRVLVRDGARGCHSPVRSDGGIGAGWHRDGPLHFHPSRARRIRPALPVPIALIPQILLAGIIVRDLPKIPDLIAHVAISGFWVYRAMELR